MYGTENKMETNARNKRLPGFIGAHVKTGDKNDSRRLVRETSTAQINAS
jgi:hypothetical protein